MRRVTISDIALEAGVDKSTVSIVLNHKPLAERIADSTKKRIFSIAEKLDYLPSLTAKSLASGKTNTLGIVLGDIGNPYGAGLSEAALEAADAKGQQLLISATKWDQDKELECMRNLMQRQVDGIIFCSLALTKDSGIYKEIVKRHYPIVLYNYKLQGISSVSSDLALGMNEAVELLDQNKHKTIGYASPPRQLGNKLKSFKNTSDKTDAKLITYEGDTIAKAIIAKYPECKAWIIFSDEAAQKVINTLSKHGIRTPEDIDIIGIDGTRWGTYNTPALTSIKQDWQLLMKHAVDLLLNHPNEAKTISVPTKLIIRDSVKLKTY
jgi:DNA-binding LacI/PurR family transcriptional regulator